MYRRYRKQQRRVLEDAQSQGIWAQRGKKRGAHWDTLGALVEHGRRLTERVMRGRSRREAQSQERKPRGWRWGWTLGRDQVCGEASWRGGNGKAAVGRGGSGTSREKA